MKVVELSKGKTLSEEPISDNVNKIVEYIKYLSKFQEDTENQEKDSVIYNKEYHTYEIKLTFQ